MSEVAILEKDYDAFREAFESLKLYRRAELENAEGEKLIEALYVDPMPNDNVLKKMLQRNTTFIIGRKGTGKSTVFLRARHGLFKENGTISTYVDIKTVYESATIDDSMAQKIKEQHNALSVEDIKNFLLIRKFVKAVVQGIRDDIEEQLTSSRWERLKDKFSGVSSELFAELDRYLRTIDQPEFIDVEGLRIASETSYKQSSRSTDTDFSAGARISSTPSIDLAGGRSNKVENSTSITSDFNKVLLRNINIKTFIEELRKLLSKAGIRHLYVFVDDFSELPKDAMESIVDLLLAPLNNWSEELIKFKIAAYPGRIYYGDIDKSKVDEIYLDMHNLYGQKNVGEMELKGIDFTRRLVEKRLAHFGTSPERLFDQKNLSQIWQTLFYATLCNPRTLGYILMFAYENHLIYEGSLINVTAIQDAAKKYYQEKVESYFSIGKFLHESFGERSTIFSLKELLENLVDRSRKLRKREVSETLRSITGRPPTSHFHISQEFDSILSTLELNFFITKYYTMSDRDGRRVSIYCLNYGLCEKYTIAFGRPSTERAFRLYYVERIFDYTPIIQDYIASNQEICCNACGKEYDSSLLPSLRLYNFTCPECGQGTCEVTNISKKYEAFLRQVDEESLLPRTELGIIQTLGHVDGSLYPGEIAGELDVSPQLIGWRGKKLSERDLITRIEHGGRRRFIITDTAKRIYLEDPLASELELSEANDSR